MTLLSESFEAGDYGMFVRAKNTKILRVLAAQGRFSAEIRDDSGVDSTLRSKTITVAPYQQLRITFSYYTLSANSGESFFLEWRSADNSPWQTIRTLTVGRDCQNGNWMESTTEWNINSASTSSGFVRFRSGFDGSRKRLILDKITLEAR